jgi:catechol 2,3-dioxygenase-like lactoylglutathione lyase family enzyme
MEVADDLQFGPMRWLTVRVPGDPTRSVLLELPAPPSMSEDTAETVRELVTKGASGGHLFFSTADARGAHARLKAAGVDIDDEPVEQPYGIDFGLRDPFGNHVRIAQPHSPAAS